MFHRGMSAESNVGYGVDEEFLSCKDIAPGF